MSSVLLSTNVATDTYPALVKAHIAQGFALLLLLIPTKAYKLDTLTTVALWVVQFPRLSL